MIYFIKTIDSVFIANNRRANNNTGTDEIVELQNDYTDVSRVIIRCKNLPTIYSSLELVMVPTNKGLLPDDLEYTINPIYTPNKLIIGTGKSYLTQIIPDGVTWNTYDGMSPWTTGSINTTGGPGGVWYTNISQSIHVNNRTTEFERINITDIHTFCLSESISTNLIIRLQENENYSYGMNFFSSFTNTIYSPFVIVYDNSDYVFTTGSMQTMNNQPYDVYCKLNNSYNRTEIVTFNVICKPKKVGRIFKTLVTRSQNIHVNETTKFAIKDYHTGEYIIPASNYTKVSCDGNTNYFRVNLNGLPPNRYYEIELWDNNVLYQPKNVFFIK